MPETFGYDAPRGAAPFRKGRVRGYAWRHDDPAASVVLVHGMQSHAGWFAEAGDELHARGFAVYALDRRGSGSSPGERGHIEHYEQWLEEIDRVVGLARREHPGASVHLAGHCFGANLALGSVLLRRTPVDTLTLLTPGMHILPRYGLADRLRILACATLRPRTRFGVPQRDELFTRDPRVLARIRADRLGARRVTARSLMQARALARRLGRDLGRLDVPLLVLEAEHDRISDNARNRALLDRALGMRWRSMRFDAEHFLLAEPCRDQVVDTIAAWATSNSHSTPEGSRTC